MMARKPGWMVNRQPYRELGVSREHTIIYEPGVDELLTRELNTNLDLGKWFLAECGLYSYPVTEIRASNSVVIHRGEADMLVVYNDRDFALLIENKLRKAAKYNQAERYVLRGDFGTGAGLWKAYKTVMLAPEKVLSNWDEAEKYDFQISYEKLQAWLLVNGHKDLVDFINVAMERKNISTARLNEWRKKRGPIDANNQAKYKNVVFQATIDLNPNKCCLENENSTAITYLPEKSFASCGVTYEMTQGMVKAVYNQPFPMSLAFERATNMGYSVRKYSGYIIVAIQVPPANFNMVGFDAWENTHFGEIHNSIREIVNFDKEICSLVKVQYFRRE